MLVCDQRARVLAFSVNWCQLYILNVYSQSIRLANIYLQHHLYHKQWQKNEKKEQQDDEVNWYV